MPKLFDVYMQAIKEGAEHGVTSADIRICLAHILKYSTQIEVLLHKDEQFDECYQPVFHHYLKQLEMGVPVEYVINEATFLGHKLYVDNTVLIPRMETEELVANISERILDYYDPRNYLVCADIGTGSGCIAIALKTLFPNWVMLASDLSLLSLSIAKKNAEANGTKITFYDGPSLTPYIQNNIALDIIVSNPPYITDLSRVQSSVKNHEPSNALYLDPAHSVYEDVFRDIGKVKKNSLLVCLEIDDNLVDYLNGLMDKFLTPNYRYKKEYLKDLNGFVRFLFLFLE